MLNRISKAGASLAVLAAVAVGASAVAGAASSTHKTSSTTATQSQARPAPPPQGGGPRHKPETALTGDTAAKVKAAALKKVPGGTIVRVETDSDHGSPYEAHVRKSNGTEVEVLVNKAFEVTAVNSFGPRG